MAWLFLIAGLVILVVGGELLVKGAVGLALKLRVSTLVIGMTVVSFGTSAPELLVSAKAALTGHPDIAMGNVLGSNIANIALVLGITTMIFPIPVDKNTIRIDWPMMMLATVGLFLVIIDQTLSFVEGAGFFLFLTGFIFWLIRKSRKDSSVGVGDDELTDDQLSEPVLKNILFAGVGCVGLVWGADWLLGGAVEIAGEFGISERIIGITIIAFGTSVPELATSVVAAFRKQTDISVGNLIGSNIFNILAILGITGMITPIPISQETLNIDMWWVSAISAILFPLMFFGRKITRWKGLILFLCYGAYIISLL